MSDKGDSRIKQTQDAVLRGLFLFTLTFVLVGVAYFIALGLLHR